jgi:putative membrane protein
VRLAANLLIGLLILEHLWFAVLELFLFKGELGRATFRMSEDLAAKAAPLAANVGVYNACFAAGLAWSLFAPQSLRFPLQAFFLGGVGLAGIAGGFTLGLPTFLVQGLPALIALALVLLAPR